MRLCAGWYLPLLFANHQRQDFSRRVPSIEGSPLFLVLCLGIFFAPLLTSCATSKCCNKPVRPHSCPNKHSP